MLRHFPITVFEWNADIFLGMYQIPLFQVWPETDLARFGNSNPAGTGSKKLAQKCSEFHRHRHVMSVIILHNISPPTRSDWHLLQANWNPAVKIGRIQIWPDLPKTAGFRTCWSRGRNPVHPYIFQRIHQTVHCQCPHELKVQQMPAITNDVHSLLCICPYITVYLRNRCYTV